MTKRISVVRFGWLPVIALPISHMMEALLRDGHEVSYVASRPRQADIPVQTQSGATNHIFRVWLRLIPSLPILRVLLRPLIFAEFAARACAAVFRSKPDLVVAVDLDTLVPAWIAARLRRAKLVYYTLELYTDTAYMPLKFLWRFIERSLIGKADLVIACEPNRARILQERYGLETTPLTVLNVSHREPDRDRTTLIQDYLGEMGVQPARIALYHGLIASERGADSLLEAAKLIDPGALVFLLGPIDPIYDKELRARIDKEGLEGRVVIHPMVRPQELSGFVLSADVGLAILMNDCLNSYYCAPTKLYGYLAAGLPVVTSDFPGLKEVVEEERVGLCVDPDDPVAIANAINRLLADDGLRAEMARNARRVSLEKYCYEVEGKKLTMALGNLLDTD